jgi:predicted metal-dependent hydrolase
VCKFRFVHDAAVTRRANTIPLGDGFRHFLLLELSRLPNIRVVLAIGAKAVASQAWAPALCASAPDASSAIHCCKGAESGMIRPGFGVVGMPLCALLYRRPSEPQAIEIVFDQSVYLVRLRRHRQAGRYTLRIAAASREVVLTMPPRGTLKEARKFAQTHGGWVAARLRRLPQPLRFADGTVFPLRGEPHRIAHRRGARGTVWIETGGDGERLVCVAGDAPHIDRRVGDFLRHEARRDLAAASRRFAAALGVGIRRVAVRDQSSRWGSCSADGALSYSWRLVLAPAFVLDYLAAHEVAHMVEMNHSARFWRVVGRLCPEHKRAKAWLDVHGADLHRYGASVR